MREFKNLGTILVILIFSILIVSCNGKDDEPTPAKLDIKGLTIEFNSTKYYTTPQLNLYPNPTTAEIYSKRKDFYAYIPLCLSDVPFANFEEHHTWLSQKGSLRVNLQTFDFNQIKIGDDLKFKVDELGFILTYKGMGISSDHGPSYMLTSAKATVVGKGIGPAEFYFQYAEGSEYHGYSKRVEDAPILKIKFEGICKELITENGEETLGGTEYRCTGYFALALQYPDYIDKGN